MGISVETRKWSRSVRIVSGGIAQEVNLAHSIFLKSQFENICVLHCTTRWHEKSFTNSQTDYSKILVFSF